MSNHPTPETFEVTIAAAYERFRQNPTDYGQFITLMRDAYAQGAASMKEESDLVCDAVEAVAARQMNNSADAAIFALMLSIPRLDQTRPLSIVVDFDKIGEQLAVYRFHKSYLPGGLVQFNVEPL